MAELWDQLAKEAKGFGGNWAVFYAVAAFLFYLIGYLTIRFHLMVLGVGTGTDLYVLDERYLFAGANFLIYSISAAATLLLLLLILSVLVYVLALLLPRPLKDRLGIWLKKLGTWWSDPTRLAVTGIVLSVFMIQVFLKKACIFNAVLIGKNKYPPDPLLPFFKSLLWSDQSIFLELYFSALLGSTLLVAGILVLLYRQRLTSGLQKFLRNLLTVLLIIQFCLLPVNYGVFIFNKSLPRLAGLEKISKMGPGDNLWLVWEGKENWTFLYKNVGDGGKIKKSLINLPRQEIQKIEILDYDPISEVLKE